MPGCLAKAKFRNGTAGKIKDIFPRTIKQHLWFCDYHTLHWIVDTETSDITNKTDKGCVYRPENVGSKSLWVRNTAGSTNRPITSRREFESIKTRRIRKAACGPATSIRENLYEVVTAKDRCQLLRETVTQRDCNACKLKAILDPDGRLNRCTKRKMIETRSFERHDLYIKNCIDDIARLDFDLNC